MCFVCVHVCVCVCVCVHVGGGCVQVGERVREREEGGSLRVSVCTPVCYDYDLFTFSLLLFLMYL